MRSVLGFGLLVALYASAGAATVVHRTTVDLRARQHVIVRPSKGVATPSASLFRVGQTTQKWLDSVTSCEGCG
jgi:hypothetical protein